MSKVKRKKQTPPPIHNKLKFKLGDLVYPTDPGAVAATYQVYGICLSWHTRNMRLEPHYFCRKIDSDTGMVQVCPDERCRQYNRDGGCVICSRNFWSDGIKLVAKHDAECYACPSAFGLDIPQMLHRDLVQFARGGIPPKRRPKVSKSFNP